MQKMEYMLTFHILNVYVDKTQPRQFKLTFKLCGEADCRLNCSYQVWKSVLSHLHFDFKAHNTWHEAKRRINNSRPTTITRVPRRRIQSRLLNLNIVIKVIVICFICVNMWVNKIVPALKSGPRNNGKNW